jgi:hypothetical protein
MRETDHRWRLAAIHPPRLAVAKEGVDDQKGYREHHKTPKFRNGHNDIAGIPGANLAIKLDDSAIEDLRPDLVRMNLGKYVLISHGPLKDTVASPERVQRSSCKLHPAAQAYKLRGKFFANALRLVAVWDGDARPRRLAWFNENAQIVEPLHVGVVGRHCPRRAGQSFLF